MERLDKVLKKTILEDDYLSMDESYYPIVGLKNNPINSRPRINTLYGYCGDAYSKLNNKYIMPYYKN